MTKGNINGMHLVQSFGGQILKYRVILFEMTELHQYLHKRILHLCECVSPATEREGMCINAAKIYKQFRKRPISHTFPTPSFDRENSSRDLVSEMQMRQQIQRY